MLFWDLKINVSERKYLKYTNIIMKEITVLDWESVKKIKLAKKKDSRGQFPGSVVTIRALIWKAKCPIQAQRCPFANFVPLYLCPVMGKKNTYRDKILRKSVLFLNKEGAHFTLKMKLFYLEKMATFGCQNSFGGASAPPTDSAAFEYAPFRDTG